MTTSVSQRLNIIIFSKVQELSILYNNAAHPDICEGWHYTHMWKTLARLHHFTKRESFSP
jgi:hypothetical protein